MDKEIQGECAECQMVNSTVEKNTTEGEVGVLKRESLSPYLLVGHGRPQEIRVTFELRAEGRNAAIQVRGGRVFKQNDINFRRP